MKAEVPSTVATNKTGPPSLIISLDTKFKYTPRLHW